MDKRGKEAGTQQREKRTTTTTTTTMIIIISCQQMTVNYYYMISWTVGHQPNMAIARVRARARPTCALGRPASYAGKQTRVQLRESGCIGQENNVHRRIYYSIINVDYFNFNESFRKLIFASSTLDYIRVRTCLVGMQL